MRGVSVLFFLGICAGWGSTQYLNNRPYPTYSLENMPDTEFTCRDKILGGYYADADTECQMFHICVKVAGVGIQDFRFLCPNGTAFDQDHQICADWEDVDCDATTLYYSSDNFDLYRLGSGFESKAVKYGEDEETFALQRAETGDARLNREHQSSRINQKKEVKDNYYRSNQVKQNSNISNNNNNNNNNNNSNNERDIFKGASSSNFFNNRNNGKEKEEDYDDNVNVNQNADYEQKKKVTRVNKQRRPIQSRTQKRIQSSDSNRDNDTYGANTEKSTTLEVQTRRPTVRPSTFINNFAGSSYIPTTSRPSSTTLTNEQYATAVNNHRGRNGQRQRQQQSSDANVKQSETNSPSTSYSSSTPAPFRQTQQYNTPPNRHPSTQNNNNGQTYTSTQAPKRDTENYPQTRPKQTTPYDDQYDTPKVKSTKAENYPTSPQYDVPKKTTPFSKTENYPSNNPKYFEKKPTTPIKQTETYPTTFPPRPKPFSASNEPSTNFPTTFAPRTSAGFTQIVQQTEQYSKPQQFSSNPPSSTQQYTQKSTTQFDSTTLNQQYDNSPSTSKSTSTQYTPTVPKISSTTPVSRSNRFDETQYDDGSYNDKGEDEFLRTAHSQNIAASRNELAKTTKQQQSSPTTPQFDTPRPFSVTSKVTETPKVTGPPKETELPRTTLYASTKSFELPEVTRSSASDSSSRKPKDSTYDYAYYDSNTSLSEPEYDIDTELKKSTVRD